MTAVQQIEASINKLEIETLWLNVEHEGLYAEELADYHNTTIQTVYKTLYKIKNIVKINGVRSLDVAYSLQILAENKTTNPLDINKTLNVKYNEH